MINGGSTIHNKALMSIKHKVGGAKPSNQCLVAGCEKALAKRQ